MSKNIEIKPPIEGPDTLVTQFSVAELGKIVDLTRENMDVGKGIDAIVEHLEELYPDLPGHVHEKIALLACGQLPPDDFEEESLVSVQVVDDRSARLELKEPKGRDVGDLVYFQGRCWIVVLRKENKVVLKRC